MGLIECLKLARLLQVEGLNWSKLPAYIKRNLVDVGLYLAQRWTVPTDREKLWRDVEWAVSMALKHGSPRS